MIKKVQKKNIPELRFPEFNYDWKSNRLDVIGDFKNGFNAEKSAFGSGIQFINLMDIFGKSEIKKKELGLVEVNESLLLQYSVKYGDVLFVRSSVKREGVAQSCLVNDEFENTIYSGFIIRFRQFAAELDFIFQRYCFSTPTFRAQALAKSTSSANTNINQESLSSLVLNYPSIEEQQKIAAFLSAVDNKLTHLRRKHTLLEGYKRGVMQQLFSQQIRFKQEDGADFPAWEEKTLNDLADRITLKNKDDSISLVLTNSARQGVVSQQDYFDKNIANSDNLEGYYVVDVDDYVYNPRISVHAPVGPIKKNKIGKGLMSPLYTIFRFKNKNNTFYEQYFETKLWHRYMYRVANYGARHDRMNITTADFMNMPLPYPSPEEQAKIVSFVSSVGKKIDAVDQQIHQLDTFKKGLLQKLFV